MRGYVTAFHELGHWTGHKSRLDPDLRHRFGERAYAAEELVAELCAALLCAQFSIDGDLRHAGYIQSWIGLLKEDHRAFFTACNRAQAAADYLLGLDLRVRVVDAVEEGASRHEAADRFGISVSSTVRWAGQFARSGCVAAKPSGGSSSPLEQHADFLLGLIEKRSDLTLDEVVAAMRAANIPGSRSAVARFYGRHDITFKKKPTRERARAPRRGQGAAAVEAPPILA
jgi:transposase